MVSILWFVFAALAEIAGCYSFWAWTRMNKSPAWLIPGMGSLIVFALALTRVNSAYAGRAYAAYGGIYIACSLFWLWLAEGTKPDRWDAAGAGICLLGATVILFGPRGS